MIVFTLILNILCKQGLGIISWFIVFVPFIFMTVISSTLLFAFGLDPHSSRPRPNIPITPYHHHRHHHHKQDDNKKHHKHHKHHKHKHHNHNDNENHQQYQHGQKETEAKVSGADPRAVAAELNS